MTPEHHAALKLYGQIEAANGLIMPNEIKQFSNQLKNKTDMESIQTLISEIEEANKTIQHRLNTNIILAHQIKNNLALNKVEEKIILLRQNQLNLMNGLTNTNP